jgi:ATP-dependent Clp protease ATP-binding subunit ClpC
VKRLKEQNISIELTAKAKEKITQEGYDPEYGARPLRRAIQKHIEDRLSEEVLKGTLLTAQHAIIDVENDEFIVKTVKRPSLTK